MNGVDGHTGGDGARAHVARLGLRSAGVRAVADENDGRGHVRPGLQAVDLAHQADDAVIERCGSRLGHQFGRVKQVSDTVVELDRREKLLRAVGLNLVDGHVIDLLLHVAGRGVLLDSRLDGRNLVGRAAGGVDEEHGQRADGGLAVEDHLFHRETVVGDKQRLCGKINRQPLTVDAENLQANARKALGVGIGDE